MSTGFLRVHKGAVVNDRGTPIVLRGVNLGGWLMMEGHILGAPNVAERVFKKDFSRRCGQAALADLQERFRSCFIQEDDIRRIASWGLNCLRVPFHYRCVERAPYRYDAAGLKYLDAVIAWAKKYRLRVILDLHAAPGCQNHDWHCDSTGNALLWGSAGYQARAAAVWGFLADRYKDEPAVAGYDLLNEAVVGDAAVLNAVYKKIITAIRRVDRRHILFIEGNTWATNADCLDEFDDDNYVVSIHHYDPIEFTFNFVPQIHYPIRSKAGVWGKAALQKRLAGHAHWARKRGVPIFVGEFGVNARDGFYGEDRWLADTLALYNQYGFHWTYWTYKAVKRDIFPDGILSYRANPAWVNRMGPRFGWERYADCWPAKRAEMITSWETKQFDSNDEIVTVLKKYA